MSPRILRSMDTWAAVSWPRKGTKTFRKYSNTLTGSSRPILWSWATGFGWLASALSGCVFCPSFLELFLFAWFILVRKLSGNQSLAVLAASLIALDYSVLSAAGIGRMDMMCADLGSAALAVYVSRRERGLAGALALSGCLGCMSLLTHPMGALYSVNLAIDPVA
jgi:hypothetical protein